MVEVTIGSLGLNLAEMKPMNDAAEITRRIARRISAASAAHMSNTKWRKLFAALHSFPSRLGGTAIKFVNDERMFLGPLPGPSFQHDDNLGECGGISYAPFAHIEYLQIPRSYAQSLDGPRYPDTMFTNDIDGLVASLGEIGAFPIQSYENGIRIVGYEWASKEVGRTAGQGQQ